MKQLHQVVPWILVGFAAVGAACIFLLPRKPQEAGNGGGGVSDAALQIKEITVRRSGDSALLRLQVFCKNASDSVLRLDARAVKLHSASGEQAPAYIRPFLPVTAIPAQGEGRGELRYWVPLGLLADSLTLTGAGGTAVVTAAGTVSAEAFAEGQEVSVPVPE